MLLGEYDSVMSLITAELKELEERLLLCLVHYFKAASPPSLIPPCTWIEHHGGRRVMDNQLSSVLPQ